ncbi:MAG: hypothetical protein KDG55_06750 [Rhodocyclaceae bacterium]|nr:hypothetical protein [Rhodocyclaceae bacterium]
MIELYIIGAGGFGREVLDTLGQANAIAPAYRVLGFIDDTLPRGTLVNGVAVAGDIAHLASLPDGPRALLAIADPAAKRRIVTATRERVRYQTLIHPTCIISPFAEIGTGCIIQGYSLVAANACLGEHVVINAHSGVGHDTAVGAFSSIMSFCDLAGGSSVGELTFAGSGVRVLPKIRVADASYLCGGAVVMKDVPTSSKMIGNPARPIG